MREMLGLVIGVGGLLAQPLPDGPPGPTAPPPAPPVWRADAPAMDPRTAVPAGGGGYWSIGDPSDEEQQLLEIINRARANPAAEADRLIALDNPYARFAYDFYLVDLDLFRAAMLEFPVAQPLAFHPQLATAARGHSQWMLANVEQSHEQGTITAADRVTASGYPWSTIAESIYAFGHDMEHVHAGFEVDWGLFDAEGNPIAPGMQDPPGHRLSNHNDTFREIGIAVIEGTNSRQVGDEVITAGPRVVTMKFGSRHGGGPMITGVAFFDLNKNGAYDPGEGLGGVDVTVSGLATPGRTTRSGGYALPAADGSRTLTFSVPGMTPVNRAIQVSGGRNVKADLILDYPPPVLAGPDRPSVGRDALYLPSGVPGADTFEWELARRAPYAAVLGGEAGDPAVLADTTPGYPTIQGDIRAAGAAAYRLAHPLPDGAAAAVDQFLTLTNRFLGGPNPRVRFQSRLGLATGIQVASMEWSIDGGLTWQTGWSRAGQGEGTLGQTQFETVDVGLVAAANRPFRVRFRYAVGEGPFYPQTSPGVGWYLDGIQVTGSDELIASASGEVAAGSPVVFRAGSTGTFALRVRPRILGRRFPFGPLFLGEAVESVPIGEVVIETVSVEGGMLAVQVRAEGGVVGLHLESVPHVGSGWERVQAVVPEPLTAGRYRFRVPLVDASAIFRVRAD